MATPAPRLLRLPLSRPVDSQSDHVLVGITRKNAADSDPVHALNLELVATDDVNVFVLSLQQSKAPKYRQDEGLRSEIEWDSDLRALLIEDPPIGDVTAVARTDGSGYMFLDIRNKVCGDTIIGSLKLRRSHKAQENLELFPWCAEALRVRDELQAELLELKREKAACERIVAEETAHFRDLEQSKREFEAQHDSWFKDLLNEKKVKIRTQDRILAAANIDPDQLAAVSKRRQPVGSSRKGKRKAAGSDIDDDMEDAADEMDVDEGIDAEPESHGELSDAGQTPAGLETGSSADESEPPQETERKENRAQFHNLRDKKASPASESESEPPPHKPAPASRKKKPTPGYDDDSTE